MNDALKMQISAFVDGELPAEEAELLTRRLSRDPALREQAGRYLAIGRLMRGERESAGAAELRRRIAAAIDGEAAPETPAAAATPVRPRYLRPLAGVAVAASVAVLALVGLQQFGQPGAAPGALPVTDMVAIDDISYTEPGVAAGGEPSELLRQYYLSHGETSGDLGANGILSRLVTLELREGEIANDADRSDDASAADDNENDAGTEQEE